MIKQTVRNSGSRGGTLVETALCLTVFCAVLIGLIYLAMTLYTFHSMSEVARLGTRWASVRGSTSCLSTQHVTTCNATAADIAAYIGGLGYGGINSSNVSVSWCNPPTGGTQDTTCSATRSPGNLVKVKITRSTNLLLPMISSKAISLTSTSQMLISQ